MRISIEKDKLELLIEKKKDYIGTKRNCIGMLNAILLLFSAYTSTYEKLIIPSIVLKFIICILAIIQIIMIICEWIKPKYTKDDLLKDIEGLNMNERNSSIIAIQNPKHPTKFLLYADQGWGLKLFPNFATTDNDINNIKRKLSEELEINPDNIHAEYKKSAHEVKYSTEHKEDRSYNYSIYKATIDGFDYYDDDSFSIAGKEYLWMTVPEMLKDSALKEHNEYVISLVRDYI